MPSTFCSTYSTRSGVLWSRPVRALVGPTTLTSRSSSRSQSQNAPPARGIRSPARSRNSIDSGFEPAAHVERKRRGQAIDDQRRPEVEKAELALLQSARRCTRRQMPTACRDGAAPARETVVSIERAALRQPTARQIAAPSDRFPKSTGRWRSGRSPHRAAAAPA